MPKKVSVVGWAFRKRRAAAAAMMTIAEMFYGLIPENAPGTFEGPPKGPAGMPALLLAAKAAADSNS